MKTSKKIIASATFVVLVAAYAVYSLVTGGEKKAPAAANPEEGNETAGNAATSSPSAAYKDGDYTGKVADAVYGDIQVKISVKNHLITDVALLEYPNDRPETVAVSDKSLPILTAETIKAQSADVDIVSGATQTSQGFIESLQSALAMAEE